MSRDIVEQETISGQLRHNLFQFAEEFRYGKKFAYHDHIKKGAHLSTRNTE